MGIRLDICAESYVSNLAAEAKENQEQSLGLEGDIESPLDNLEQEVLGHWLGGWDWATIGSLMEDKGYKGEDIEKAMQAALHHVESIEKAGPFGTLRTGQLVRLKNGILGQILAKSENTVDIHAFSSESTEVMEVPFSQIDEAGIPHLVGAFCLRKAAVSVLQEAKGPEATFIKCACTLAPPDDSVTRKVYNAYNALVQEMLDFNVSKGLLKSKLSEIASEESVGHCVRALLDNETLGMYSIFESLSDSNKVLVQARDIAVMTEQDEIVRPAPLMDLFQFVSSNIAETMKINTALGVLLDQYKQGKKTGREVMQYVGHARDTFEKLMTAWGQDHAGVLDKVLGEISKRAAAVKENLLKKELEKALEK